MKVLVTGGTGFIGSHLVQRLWARGDQVVCIAKDEANISALKALGVHIILDDLNADLDWGDVLHGVEVIYHLAGVTRARRRQEYDEMNHLTTKRFVDICVKNCQDLRRFVYVSSLAAVGPALDGKPLMEDAPYRPVSEYGRSKMFGELAVLAAKDQLPITVIRPATVYGPRDRDFYDLIKLVKHGILPAIGFQEKLLSILHSDDLVDGLLELTKHAHTAKQIYYLGSEKFYSARELGAAIGRAVKREPLYVPVPHLAVYAVAAVAEILGKLRGKQVFLNIQKAREMVQPAWICSTEKAKEHFGFRPRVSLEDGMRETHTWYCDNGWL